MQFHYIAVEGPIGVGKTLGGASAWPQRLEAAHRCSRSGARTRSCKPFYDGQAGRRLPDRAVLPALALPPAAGAAAAQALPAGSPSCDYVFEKSKLFAYLNLDDSELLIYEKLYALLAESVPRPDLVVYLQAPTEVLMRRIRPRGRPEEARLSEEYLAEVNRAYNHYFFHYTQTPLLVVNTADVDFVEARRGRRRPAEADPQHGQGHAVLRAAGKR